MRHKVFSVVILGILLFLLGSNISTAQQFGKNKTQHKVFDWKYIESKHFDIYYENSSKYLAEFSVGVLEEALGSIQNTLNFKLTQRISVIVYDSHNDFQQTNVINMYLSQGIGGVTELYKNRVIVPFQGDYSQLRHVLHHELVHAVINDMFYGGNIQTAISTTGNFFLPLWLNEGLAEWESLGGMNIETDIFMRDLTMSESLPDLEEISGYLAYRAGQTFYSLVAEKYGRGKITELLNKLKTYRNINTAFENTFGMNLEDFSELWKTEIKKTYWPDINIYQSPKEFSTQLTNHEKENCFYFSSPAISPDGEQMAYISDMKGGVFSVFVAPIDTNKKKSKPRKLVSSARENDFEQLNILTPGISWSPDNKKIAISAKSGGEDAIYILETKNGKYEKIKLGFSSITSVIWSPDGSKIGFIGSRSAQSDIFYYDLSDKKVIPITNDVFSDKFPVWAPDSKSIYFISDRGDNTNIFLSTDKIKIWELNYEQSDIYKVDISNNKITRVTNSPDISKTSISVSNNNSKLLFVSSKNGIGNIYELDLKTNVERPITNSANGITQISMTPDDLNLIFSTQIKGGYDIFLMRNPFERELGLEELPLTNFMQRTTDKNKQFSNISNNLYEDEYSDPEIYYGDYSIDFSNQEFLRPNPDVNKPILENTSQEIAENISNLNYPEKNYKVNFSLDAFLVNPGFSTFYGFQGNGAVMFSDIMGNHQIFLQAYLLNDLKNSQFFAAYLYNTNIIDYSLAMFNTSAYTYNYIPEFNNSFVYSYRSTGATLGSSYPIDLFRRVELKLNLVNASKENAEFPQYESTSRFLAVPEFQFVLDNSINGIYAPTRGTRLNFRALYSPQFTSSSSEFFTLAIDARQYLEIIPHFMSVALRGSIGASFGGRTQSFYMGGTDNWINSTFKSGNFELKEPEDFAFMQNFLMPLRGYSVCEISGNKYFITNLEYRFPIFMALMTGGVPLLVQGVMGNAFFDLGGVWSENFRISYTNKDQIRQPGNLLMSAGWGLRAIILGLPVKFDMAWKNTFSGWSSPVYLFSLGLDF